MRGMKSRKRWLVALLTVAMVVSLYSSMSAQTFANGDELNGAAGVQEETAATEQDAAQPGVAEESGDAEADSADLDAESAAQAEVVPRAGSTEQQSGNEAAESDADTAALPEEGGSSKVDMDPAPEEEAPQPTTVTQTAATGGATITASYSSDVFEGDVVFHADARSAAQIEKSSEAVDELVGESHSATVLFAYDLYFVDQNGTRIEPADNVKISIVFDTAQNEGTPGELHVVHIKDNGEAEYIEDAAIAGDGSSAVFTNDEFSEYDVIAESGTIVEVASEEELQAIIADLNANGGEKYVNLTQDIAYASNHRAELTKGELTVLGEGHKLTATFYVKNNAVLNLGMDGYSQTLTVNSSRSDYGVIGAMGSSTVNLYDGVTLGPCSRIGSAGGITADSLSVINMYGGTITGCQSQSVSGGVYITNNASFNMYGGTIENCSGMVGGAVGMAGGSPLGGSNEGKCQFNMSGGTIRNCVDQYRGGGAVNAYAYYPVKMTISGGTIENCSSTGSFGGGICLVTTLGSTFEMNGGTITGNQCPNGYGGGILVYSVGSDSHIHFNDGVIENNQAIYGGGVFLFRGADIVIADGFGIYNNSASSAGDDIFNNGISATLGKADTSAELDATGMNITGWYYDGTTDEDGEEGRWAWDPDVPESDYLKPFEHISAAYSGEYGIKAAHGEPVYTIVFDKNAADATGETASMEGVKYTEKKTLTENGFARTGYTWAGWNTKADGSGDSYTDKQEVEKLTAENNGTVTLYAQWTPIVYNITYNLDGGQLESEASNPATYTVESDDITLNNPAKEGYTFKGWTGTGLDSASKTVTIAKGSTGDREYTATWEPVEYTITYDLDGGALADGVTNPGTYTIETDDITLNNPAKEGYTFQGWTGTELDSASKTVTIAKGSTGDRAYTAAWEANSYKVRFDANKGTGTMEDETFAYDEEKALTKNVFTRAGYTFTGWKDKADGTGTEYADEATVSKLTAEDNGVVTLYAQWTANDSKLTYNANGGIGEVAEKTGKTDEVVKTAANGFTREGYTFDSWNTEADGSGTKYAENADFTLAPAPTVLYAQWTPVTYNITYDLQGGALAEGTSNPATYTIETDDITLNNPTKEGYTFEGWTGTELDSATETVTIAKGSTGDREYTATWTPVEYTITYDLDGGALADGESNPGTYTIESDDITLNNPTKEGYTFKGWTGTGLDTATETVTIAKGSTGNRAYKAAWEINQYTITFDSNGGSAIDPITQNYDTAVTAPKDPTREGYDFGGWTDKDGNPANVPAKIPAKDTKLTAKWTPVTYNITYDLQGGALAEGKSNPATYTIESDDITLNNPTRTGYTFTGWTGTGLDSASKNVTISKGSTGNRTYTATWKANEYTVKFDANEGTGTMADQTFQYDEEKALTKNAFTRAGYTFTGWNDKKDGSGTGYSNEQAVKNLTAEDGAVITLYAQWKINEYTITFDSNGGSEVAPITQDYGSDVTAPKDPTREGYDFGGWTDKDGNPANVPAKMPTKNTTLKAKWTPNSYKVKFDANNGNGSMEDQAFAYDEEKALTGNAFTRAGYTFTGWNTADDGTGTGYADKAEVKNLTAKDGGEVTLYAQWNINEYEITFDPNGGEYEGTADPTTEWHEYGEVITMKAPTREGHKFLYWKGSEYYEGDEYTVSEDHEFVAQWEKVEEPQVEPEEETPQPAAKPEAPAKDEPTDKPRTGDPSSMTLPILTGSAALLGMALLLITRKRRKDNE